MAMTKEQVMELLAEERAKQDQAGTSPGSQMQDSQGVGEEKMLVFIGSFVALIAF